MIPGIDTTYEVLIYAVNGFVTGRFCAGWAYRNKVNDLKGRRRHYEEPSPSNCGFWAFVGGTIFWPVVWFSKAAESIGQKSPGFWPALGNGVRWVFMSRPPKRERLEARKANLEERTKKLERELEIA